MLCPICTCVITESQDTPCGHVFCESCIKAHLSTGKKNCPLDRASLTEKDLRRSTVVWRDMLGKLKTVCDHSSKGCTWENKWSLLPAHLEKECLFSIVKCSSNRCPVQLPRKDFAQHAEVCNYVNHRCKYCSEQIFGYNNLVAHFPACAYRPIRCACLGTILQKDLENHGKTCPEKLVPCSSFLEYGCKAMIKRKDAQKHLKQATNDHLELLVVALRTLRGQNEALETAVYSLHDAQNLSNAKAASFIQMWNTEQSKQINLNKYTILLLILMLFLPRELAWMCTLGMCVYLRSRCWIKDKCVVN